MLPLASEGNVLSIAEFWVLPGRAKEMSELFREFDDSTHLEPGAIKSSVLCQDPQNEEHFFLIGEWQSVEAHKDAIRRHQAAAQPAFVRLIAGGVPVSRRLNIVMSTPPELLAKGKAQI